MNKLGKERSVMGKSVLRGVFALWLLLMIPCLRASAEELTPVIVSDSSQNTITITAKDGSGIGAVYIKWDDPVVPYQIKTDQGTVECGKYGFLHEFILLPENSQTVTVLLPQQKMSLYKKGLSRRKFGDSRPCRRRDSVYGRHCPHLWRRAGCQGTGGLYDGIQKHEPGREGA